MKHGSGALLSLASQKALSFSRDGGAEAVWRGSASLAEGDAGNCSVAISSSSDDAGVEEDENSGLKERDYIGLAKVSSPVKPVPGPNELSLSETDLQLGLGLGLGLSMKASGADDSEKTLPFPITQIDGLPKVAMDTPKYAFTGSGHTSQKPWPNAAGSMRPMTAENITSSIVSSAREFQSPKASIHAEDFSGEGPSSVGSTFYGGNPNSALKNGTKRGYTEAMNEAARFNMVTVIPTAAATRNGDGDAKNLPNHQQGTFIPNWVPSKPTLPAHWQDGLEQSSVHSFTPNKPAPVTTVPRVEKPVADHAAAARKPNVPCEAAKEPASNDPPPSKGQVVGWPPVCSYRRHNLSKPTEMFVKVNMDGMTVGRKVDLNAHSSYEGLFSALEEMFQPSNNGGQGTPQVASGRENHANNMKQFRLLHGSEYVLTYEDQEGDWMLVGDVPWSMFVNLVRRLRITHGSEATGLAPRRPVKTK